MKLSSSFANVFIKLQGKEMENNSSGSSGSDFMEEEDDPCCSQFCSGPNPWMARYVYGFIFLVTNLFAWGIRDYGHGLLREVERLKGCDGGRYCLGTEGVLRVSLGCFIFYFTMFLSTVGTNKLRERRDLWHSGWWSAKIIMYIGLMLIPFFLPTRVIEFYGRFAATSTFYLRRNSTFWRRSYPSNSILYRCICSLPSGSSPNVHLVCKSDLLFAKPLLHYVYGGSYPSHDLCLSPFKNKCRLLDSRFDGALCVKKDFGFLSPYCLLIVYSEPPTESCKKRAETSARADWLTIISFILALLAMVIATFSTGIDSKSFQVQFRKDEVEKEDDVPYGYGFFHFVFAMGAMYFAMLLIGWNSHHTMRKWTIDVGWTSTWVRIVNEWLAACVYIWMLVAPVVWKNRIIANSS
ncbi:hypothetical protein GIB67_020531 [Kingdonia uniflora]|uniref:Serine incorporator n=1 Tax=Kingdonia uniflora TaxID=39325 RepID=A0A7J7NL33_9MAGN|nr:hypothetical protein GIB67_020531 [Kingdonia uniflora]